MEMFAGYTDDALALMGCAAAFVFCGGVMFLSGFANRRRRETNSPAIVRRPLTREARTSAARVVKTGHDASKKRAA
jgi:hypothetical protein